MSKVTETPITPALTCRALLDAGVSVLASLGSAAATTTAVYCGLPIYAPAGPVARTPAPSEAAPAGPDAELLALGKALESADADLTRAEAEHDKAWKAGREHERLGRDCDEKYARCGAIVEQIAGMPARTLEGMRVKARAVAWIHKGEEIPAEGYTNERLAFSIARDLLAPPPAGSSDDELVALCEAFLAADADLVAADLAVDAAKFAAERASDPEEKARLRSEVPVLAARYCILAEERQALETRLLDAQPSTLAGAVALARVVERLLKIWDGEISTEERFALNLAQSVAQLGRAAS